MIAHIGMHKMHHRPPPGARIIVEMKDGRQLNCSACMVYIRDRRGIIIYHKRYAIDENDAVGWWPSHEIMEFRERKKKQKGGML